MTDKAMLTHEQFRNEQLYQMTMKMAENLLHEGVITEEEYRQIDTKFKAKYHPVFGTLSAKIR